MPIILNKEELGTTQLRKDALEILETGLEAIQTEKILRKKISFQNGIFSVDGTEFNLNSYKRVFFVGIGKCALDGAKAIEDILQDRLTDGIALDVKEGDLKKIKVYAGTHPYPSEANVSATKKILEMVKDVTEKDFIITLISGGGSSLFSWPHGLSVEALTEITKTLTEKGADIFELNTVRKHLSEVQGGQFLKRCYPAFVVSLIFSDVFGNDTSIIASGPTVLDPTTFIDAEKILNKYGIFGQKPIETPKDSKYFEKVKNILIASNADALEAMEAKAWDLGYKATIETDRLSGNANEIGKELGLRYGKNKTCVLLGGETTVKISANHGLGGRNQTMALSALPHIPHNSILICAASDGWDNTDHAGAIADIELFEKAKEMNLKPQEFLDKNDSYNFFKKVGGWIYTGRLGVNVSDLYILLYS